MSKPESTPEADAEQERNFGLILLMSLTHAYYRMVEAAVSKADWFTSMDLELNESYFWVVQNLTNLLANNPHLQDFPGKFEPTLTDLYPTTIGDLEWQYMVAPHVEGFLATVHKYVALKGTHKPEENSLDWMMVEAFRPGIELAIKRADRYKKRIDGAYRRLLKETDCADVSQPSSPPAQMDSSSSTFHAFLSHNSKDKSSVRELKAQLEARLLRVWFDETELRPGMPWQKLLEQGIRNSQSVVVLIGRDGLGPWEDEEMQGALQLAVRDKRPVIPVLLPKAPSQPELPMFLGNRTWVDMRGGFTSHELDKLQWGITGLRREPAPSSNAATSHTATQSSSEPGYD